MFLFNNFFLFFEKIIHDLFVDINYENVFLNFDHNEESSRIEFGDLSTNIALLLSKKLKKNPIDIAKIIEQELIKYNDIFKIEIVSPGFINIFFKDEIYKNYYKNLLTNPANLYENIINDKKYNIEFVSANPTGPLHIGHGRGGIIGDVCVKALRLKGLNVDAEYYINDAGIQIEKLGKSVYYQYCILCNVKDVIFPDGGYNGEYILNLAKKIYDKNGDKFLLNNIDWFSCYAKDILLNVIKSTLFDYQISFDKWFSENNLHKSGLIDQAIKKLINKGYVYATDEGTVWFKSTVFGDEKDRVLKKSDGVLTYTASDIAYFLNKLDRGYTDIVMVLGQDHHSFKIRMQSIAQAFEFDLTKLHIILYQLVTLKNEGEVVRMSKRKGNSIELQSIIDTVGSDVARFFYLQRKADAHLDFDINEALEKSNKNPVFYIQYALVRIKSILEKVKMIDNVYYIDSIEFVVLDQKEKIILRKIALFDKLLTQICVSFEPHLLTYYVLELVALFHAFYTTNTIISEDKNMTRYRIGLLHLIKLVLEKSVVILGISIPDKM